MPSASSPSSPSPSPHDRGRDRDRDRNRQRDAARDRDSSPLTRGRGVGAGMAGRVLRRDRERERDPQRGPGQDLDATFIGPYRVLSHVGSGAFASVYRVWDAGLQRTLALKILADNWSHHADIRRRFQQEARILAAIDHPHVVRVHTTATLSNGRPYFVMDDADRGTLAERLDAWRASGTLPSVHEALQLSVAIGEGLRAVHAHGVIVRDLKPGNILFRSLPSARSGSVNDATAERLLLSDFGVARLMDAATRSTIVAGTPHYMAPEQADPNTAGSIDARVDIYAAAVLLYELLTGSVPWPYASHAEVLHAQTQATAPPDVSERLPAGVTLPDGLREHLMAALQRYPAARPADADAWLAGLQTVLAAVPVAEPQATATPPDAGASPQRYGSADADAATRAGRQTERTPRPTPATRHADDGNGGNEANPTAIVVPGSQTATSRAQRQRRLRLAGIAVLAVLLLGALAVFASGSLNNDEATPAVAALIPATPTQEIAPTATTAPPTPNPSAPLSRAETRAVTRFASIDANCRPAAASAGEQVGQIRCVRDGFIVYFIAYADGPTANAYATYYRATFQPRESAWAANGQQGSILRFRDGNSEVAYLTIASEGFGIWVAASDGDAAALDAWLDPATLMGRP